MTLDEKVLREIEEELTAEIRAEENHILRKLKAKLGRESYTFQMFNGLFGGKNNYYVDSVNTQFRDFTDFYSKWLKGVVDDYEERASRGYTPINHQATLLKDPQVEAFVRLFLQRNFFRNLKARTRAKPEEQLWAVWFGYSAIYGLLIAPKYHSDTWHIDKSEIRRVNYKYWTIEHILTEGLIDNESDTVFEIEDLKQFETIYTKVLKKLSSSVYEKEFYDRYILYLEGSGDYLNEPFLIPELRYGGLEKKHKYRIDFTILNPHTMDYVGFEISPASSHMSVSKFKEKQVLVNKELSEKWGKEMKKRNDYFEDYGITIITFTDEMLKDMDDCWSQVENILSKRPDEETSIVNELGRITDI